MEPIKLRATMTWTFMVDPNWYIPPDRSPEGMALVEQNQDDMEAIFVIGLEADDFTYTVKPEPTP